MAQSPVNSNRSKEPLTRWTGPCVWIWVWVIELSLSPGACAIFCGAYAVFLGTWHFLFWWPSLKPCCGYVTVHCAHIVVMSLQHGYFLSHPFNVLTGILGKWLSFESQTHMLTRLWQSDSDVDSVPWLRLRRRYRVGTHSPLTLEGLFLTH